MNRLRYVLVITALLAVTPAALAQYPGSGQVQLDAMLVPHFIDPLPHFAYPGSRVDATAPGTPLMVEAMALDEQALSTGTVLPNGVTVSATTGLTHVWGYRVSNGAISRGPYWPGFTVEARRGVPLNVLYLNKLEESYDAVNLAVDQTLHWAMGHHDDPMAMPNSMEPYTGPVPVVFHLHGGEVPPWSDGGPDAWFTPFGAMGGATALTNVFHYPNTQEAATLWFHDHALGATRLNVYAGLAAFYLLRDEAEDALHLPGWSGDGLVQEIDRVTGQPHGAPYLPEIEIALQDRAFDQNGQLYFSTLSDNPADHPFWVPEFVGNIMTVNSRSWPYLSVAPRKYRFRMLGGSNARFYELRLEDLATGTPGPAIQVIGTDGGLLDTPVVLDPALGGRFLIAPGERYDVIIDFSTMAAPGRVWTLINKAGMPYPDGAKPKPFETGQIMQFVVNGQMVGPDASVVTGRTAPLEKLVDFVTGLPTAPVDKVRQLTLNEVMGGGGPLAAIVNNTYWTGDSDRPYDDYLEDPSGMSEDLISEVFREGETELIQIMNMTMDAHPIHFHLVQFQLVSRQRFDMKKYMKRYMEAYMMAGAPADPAGWGPPLHYYTGEDPSGMKWTPYLGGNPDVTPFLKGAPRPAAPEEQGWKDTFIMYPGEVTTVIIRWAPQDADASGHDYFDFDPSANGGYVWHCHIVDHEDNEMMRPTFVFAAEDAPAGRLSAPIYPGYWTTHPEASLFAIDRSGLKSRDLPAGYALAQNSPNPFNPTTEIRFGLPEDAHVRLALYDVRGRKVATLIDAPAPAGNHTVSLDASRLASGVYFYRLDAGRFSETRKMVLAK